MLQSLANILPERSVSCTECCVQGVFFSNNERNRYGEETTPRTDRRPFQFSRNVCWTSLGISLCSERKELQSKEICRCSNRQTTYSRDAQVFSFQSRISNFISSEQGSKSLQLRDYAWNEKTEEPKSSLRTRRRWRSNQSGQKEFQIIVQIPFASISQLCYFVLCSSFILKVERRPTHG